MTTKVWHFGQYTDLLLLRASLVKTRKRLTFHIEHQDEKVWNKNENGIMTFTASNGYEIISEHRMDIQSRRLWLFGAADDQSANRSGSMAVPTQALCEAGWIEFPDALCEWANRNRGYVELHMVDCD